MAQPEDVKEHLNTAVTTWSMLYDETKPNISAMKEYYRDIKNKRADDVIQQARSNRKDLKENLLKRHEAVSADVSAAKLDLETQVETSENHVERINKYGPKAVVGIALLSAVIAAGGGAKAGWVIAVVAGVVGFFVVGALAFAIYLVIKWRYNSRRSMWEKVKDDNQARVAAVGRIKDKKSTLSEIVELLNDINKGNMETTANELVKEMNKY